MCLRLLSLDQTLGRLFDALDRTGADYQVVLTADHSEPTCPSARDTPRRPSSASPG